MRWRSADAFGCAIDGCDRRCVPKTYLGEDADALEDVDEAGAELAEEDVVEEGGEESAVILERLERYALRDVIRRVQHPPFLLLLFFFFLLRKMDRDRSIDRSIDRERERERESERERERAVRVF
jgi:hypothetical protein